MAACSEFLPKSTGKGERKGGSNLADTASVRRSMLKSTVLSHVDSM